MPCNMRGALVAVVLSLGASAAWSQGKIASKTADEIFARKILMDTVDDRMDALDFMLSSDRPPDLAKAVEDADTISVMLMTLPHLFSAESNRWRPNVQRNPARDTYAAPELWQNFPDFYRRAAEASQIALKASRVKTVADFKVHFEALRGACEACHAAYVKPPGE